jgi:hypothetical protein
MGLPAADSAKATPDAKAVTLPCVRSWPIRFSSALNINRPLPSARGLSVGVSVTSVTVPNREATGWLRI